MSERGIKVRFGDTIHLKHSVFLVRETGFEPVTFRCLPETSVLSLASHFNEV